MSKPFVIGFFVGLALLLVAGVGASRLHQKDAEQAKQRTELAEFQAELGDATPVQLGVLTENERAHSKLYGHYLGLRNYRTISGLVEQAKGKSKIVETGVLIGLGPVLSEPETPENYFSEVARESDAVIRGRVIKKVSQITEDDAFLFTDYDVVITEVLKSDVTASLEAGARITVTRPGGKVLLDGIIVRAKDDSFAPLPVNNHEVVLFLKRIPETGAYRAARDTGTFELDGSILRALTGCAFPPGVLRDGNSFLQTARAVSKR